LASSNASPSDIFALGMLIYTIHSSEHKPLNECHNDLGKCRRFLESFKGSNISAKLLPISETLRDTVKLMLSHNPELRLDAHQFIKVVFACNNLSPEVISNLIFFHVIKEKNYR